MATILLPTMAAFKGDIETMFSLLEKTVPQQYKIGLEIIGKPSHFIGEYAEENLNKIKNNLEEIAKGAQIVVHGFSGLDIYETGSADMRTEQGRALLKTYLKLAQDIGAGYVHVHSAAGYRGESNERAKQKAKEQIRKNMLGIIRETRVTLNVGIENLPCPSMGDVETDPEKIWKDHVESLEDCLSVVQGTDLKVTLDTCHYACGIKEPKINLVKAAKQLDAYLNYLHISDVNGYWIPKMPGREGSAWIEGVIPGNGRIGEEAFAEFFKYIRENKPDIGICIEVSNKDFKNPEESRDSITKVISWLS